MISLRETETMYCVCNFSLNLKLFQNKNTYFKMSYMIVVGKKGNERIKTEKKEMNGSKEGRKGTINNKCKKVNNFLKFSQGKLMMLSIFSMYLVVLYISSLVKCFFKFVQVRTCSLW